MICPVRRRSFAEVAKNVEARGEVNEKSGQPKLTVTDGVVASLSEGTNSAEVQVQGSPSGLIYVPEGKVGARRGSQVFDAGPLMR